MRNTRYAHILIGSPLFLFEMIFCFTRKIYTYNIVENNLIVIDWIYLERILLNTVDTSCLFIFYV